MGVKLKKKDNEVVIKELLIELNVAKGLLEKWHKQHSDKTYTETFYQNLIKDTEKFLWKEQVKE